MVQTKKRWTASEDKYLRLALKEGKSASEVARNLGRSSVSVTARKLSLKLKGRFKRSTKAVIQTNRVIKAIQNGGQDATEVFKLESGVQMPKRLSKYSDERNKLRNTFQSMEVGQSFIITGNLVNAARVMANEEFESMKVRIVHTTPDKKFARVFRVA